MKTEMARSGLLGAAIVAVVTACGAHGAAEDAVTTADQTSTHQLSGYDLPQGTFALMFDDGPGARTEELANWLGERGIVATFFMNGKNAPGHDAALAAIKARGHVLANHTQNHDDMTAQSGETLYRAVADTDAIIARYQPNGPWLLRPPYGAWNARLAGEINGGDLGKYVGPIFWDVGGELTATHAADWDCWSKGLSVDDCAERYMTEMNDRGRGVILMHDVHAPTVDMVKRIVETMQGRVSFIPLTSVPAVASALGVQSTTLPSSGDAPAPGATEACGSVTYAGFCTQNTLTWCQDNVLRTADCTTKGKVCNLVDEATGHDCVAATPCGDVDYNGSCAGNVLTWCDESGALRRNDCAARGQSCALVDAATGYNCQ